MIQAIRGVLEKNVEAALEAAICGDPKNVGYLTSDFCLQVKRYEEARDKLAWFNATYPFC